MTDFSVITIQKEFTSVSVPAWTPKVKDGHAGLIVEGSRPTKKLLEQKITLLPQPGEPIEAKYQNQCYAVDQFEEEKVMPGDTRAQVEATTSFPNCIHTYLEMTFGDNSYVGSGIMIGPHHILTCGHNVFDPEQQKWADKIFASPGANETKAHFGRYSVTKVFTLTDWTKNKREADLALLLLEKDIGYYTGWASFSALEDAEFEDVLFYVSGYPGDKKTRGLWEMKGEITQKLEKVLSYKISTYAGQSGSGVWRKGAFPLVAGVHVRGTSTHNEATRLSTTYFEWLRKCMEQGATQANVGETIKPQASNPAKTRTTEQVKPLVQCISCGQQGHYAPQCPSIQTKTPLFKVLAEEPKKNLQNSPSMALKTEGNSPSKAGAQHVKNPSLFGNPFFDLNQPDQSFNAFDGFRTARNNGEWPRLFGYEKTTTTKNPNSFLFGGFPDDIMDFACRGCGESYNLKDRIPRCIPCGHTVCSTCLQVCIKGKKLTCFLDRSTHDASQGVLTFRKNFAIINEMAYENGNDSDSSDEDEGNTSIYRGAPMGLFGLLMGPSAMTKQNQTIPPPILKKIGSVPTREELINKAKASEKNKKYDETVDSLRQLMNQYGKLTKDERNMVISAYKNSIDSRRETLATLPGTDTNSENTRKKLKEEIKFICNEVFSMIETREQFFLDTKSADARVAFLCMRADYYRYMVPSITGEEQASAVKESLKGYQEALTLAEHEFSSADHRRLGVVVNFTVFLYGVKNHPNKARKLAKKALDLAEDDLFSLDDDEYQLAKPKWDLILNNYEGWQE